MAGTRTWLLYGGLAFTACGGSAGNSHAPDASSGIVPNLFVVGVQAPPSVAAGFTCQDIPDPTLPLLSNGTLDVGLASTPYAPALLLGNTTASPSGADSGRILVTGADVTVTDTMGASIGAFHDDATTLVDGAGPSGEVAYGIVTVTLLDAAVVAHVAASLAPAGSMRVLAHVTLVAQDATGVPVRSLSFAFPITVCAGCLVVFPPDSVDPTLPLPNCAATTLPMPNFAPCVTGQDQHVDCRLCRGQPVCQPKA